MDNILFNSGTTYDKGGQKMNVVPLSSIDVVNTKKEDLPWLQVFNCGYRVTNDNIDWNSWNGCIYIDLDTKHYYEEVKKFNANNLLKGLYDYLYYNYYTNFYCIQKSNSGTGYHIIFYFNTEKNAENYDKCQYWSTKIVEEAFISLGAEKIIRYKKVLDNCTKSPVQGMYLTNHELLFGNIENNQWFGNIDIDSIEVNRRIINNPKYINDDGTNNFNIEGDRTHINNKKYYEHRTRMSIYMSLIAVIKDKQLVDDTYSEIVNEQFAEGNGHTTKWYINEAQKDKWFDQYEKYKHNFVRPYILKEIGYDVIEKFIPETYSFYKSDVIYDIESNQYLADIDIKFDINKINHIFAGCGFGKTTWAKKLGINNRVCVISPLTSINKDAFSEENGWLVIDNTNKDITKHIFNGSIYEALNSHWNICTTWESFSLYEMYKYSFDYFIIDEIHTLYMYDYRIKSIRQLKTDFPKCNGIKIIMTGTPSYELFEFDCYKIQINKEQPKTPAEILFYNDSYIGWIYKDIKEWINNDNNVAIIFKDQANYKDIENMSLEGIDCDIFNSNYKENVNYILDNNNIKNNVTIFSVYGQAGINLYIDLDKKVRLYILNNNGLGIIQYANRVRNKNVIDKVVIPFKKAFINNDIEKIDTYIDIDDANRRADVLNSTIKPYDIFDQKTKSIILLRYGFVIDCLDIMDDKIVLNESNYKIYKTIKNVETYERQIQIINNRLIENNFNVKYNYLYKDVKTNKSTKMRSNQFAGNIINFDFSQIEIDENGHVYIKPNDKLRKVTTGNLIEILVKIFNHFRNSGLDIENEFDLAIKNIIKKKGNITKTDLENLSTYYWLKDNWDNFYNNAFVIAMKYDNWDEYRLAAAYTRTIFNNTMTEYDWHTLSDEVYVKIKKLRKIYNMFITEEDKKELEECCNTFDVPCDNITMMIYQYLVEKHTRGKKNTKSVIINGITYSSINEASTKLGISRQAIHKRLKHT